MIMGAYKNIAKIRLPIVNAANNFLGQRRLSSLQFLQSINIIPVYLVKHHIIKNCHCRSGS